MRDGRPANLSWLQESPDPLTTNRLGQLGGAASERPPRRCRSAKAMRSIIELGARLHSRQSLSDARHTPGLGRGSDRSGAHSAYGRYATNVGANPLKILDPIFDQETGELAIYATRVAIRKTGQNERVVKDEGPTNLQQGVKLVATLAADRVDLSKETKFVIR
jgi:hypothetical protein